MESVRRLGSGASKGGEKEKGQKRFLKAALFLGGSRPAGRPPSQGANRPFTGFLNAARRAERGKKPSRPPLRLREAAAPSPASHAGKRRWVPLDRAGPGFLCPPRSSIQRLIPRTARSRWAGMSRPPIPRENGLRQAETTKKRSETLLLSSGARRRPPRTAEERQAGG